MGNTTDTIFSGANGAFIAEIYERYLDDPSSVDASWAAVFADLDDDDEGIRGEVHGASWARSRGCSPRETGFMERL